MTTLAETAQGRPAAFDPTAPLVATGNLRRRMIGSRLVEAGASLAALAAVAMLGIIVYAVFTRGLGKLSLGFVFSNPSGLTGGGIANSLIGTGIVVLLGALIAVPVGVLTGLYLAEFAGAGSRIAGVLRLALDLLQGMPTIVVGLFVYGLIVIPEHKETGFAGAVALSIVMLPLTARSSQEVLLLVPGSMREAADALGVSRWRSVVGVVLPAALGGIVTGAILSIARAAGETAPLLVCNQIFNPDVTQLSPFGHGVPSIPILILTTTDLAVPDAFARAWGAAFVLLVFILLANIGARMLLSRSRARMGR